MKALKVAIITVLVYVGIVVAFETLLGIIQPTTDSTLVLTTFDREGNSDDRVLQSLPSGDQLYVAVNHWPRAWYGRMLENPDVNVTLGEVAGEYRAVQVTGAERDRVDAEHSLPFLFRVLTGFPARHIIRLDPR